MRSSPLTRRDFLASATAGALAAGTTLQSRLALAAAENGGGPLAPRPGHFPPKAERLIVVFLTGGYSQVDTFDPKPQLTADHGKEFHGGFLLGSPFKFQACGQSGLMLSELFPHLAGVADELCVLRTLHTDIVEHFQATLAMHTGSATVPMPSLGTWVSYALGTHNANLPSYMVLAEHLPYAGAQVWDNSFLPPHHQGVRITPGDEPIPDLRSAARSVRLAELEQLMLRDVNRRHAAARAGDVNLAARASSFDVARGMMHEAPEAFDVTRESRALLDAYGVTDGDRKSFAWQCLVTRRLIERGVRVVELIDTGSHDNWDAHGDMQDHRKKAARVDQALAALIRDLRQRGLLESTLIVGCTEFGRTPWALKQGEKGRNHHAEAFSCFLAGAGVRGGMTYGETDQYGAKIVKDPVHVHDYHATILHLLGLDHTRLTYRYAGRDFRLTDVSGNVLRPILA
ncbi:MAG TPA: DUF1501 domain-containing protein [Pirellulales bacterium]|nr:DUF1501 domain-containing protein [Pirellulales bacterium]